MIDALPKHYKATREHERHRGELLLNTFELTEQEIKLVRYVMIEGRSHRACLLDISITDQDLRNKLYYLRGMADAFLRDKKPKL